jgi:sugar O-acyltransferase (sialic acid O-acetyltransferase NeuD family)
MRDIILIGAGRQAKAVIAAAEQAGFEVRAVYDDDQSRWGTSLRGVPIVGPLLQAEQAALPAVLGLDHSHQRKESVERLILSWETIVHPGAFLHPSTVVGPGTVILEGAVVQASVTIGRHVIVAANVTVSHDCVIDDFVCLGPGVDLAGSVHVAEGASCNVGAVVTPNIRVGAWSTVGPRAGVIRDVPDQVSVTGLPAKAIDDEEPGSGPWPSVVPTLALWMFFGSLVAGLRHGAGRARLQLSQRLDDRVTPPRGERGPWLASDE